ncbi:hypothetical protein BSZ32_11600 [Rubritalea profundi]|uniref:Uncharacterized protein n=1 Tax=Rubritalea profundi TaxID=1658618 RepID=A0A2S7U3R1_9BACT|nr:hypothetical protein BSZ32_11600 [Rubritalea profundi]
MFFLLALGKCATRKAMRAGRFLDKSAFLSVMVLAPFPRLALIDQKITPVLVSFDSLSGIRSWETSFSRS